MPLATEEIIKAATLTKKPVSAGVIAGLFSSSQARYVVIVSKEIRWYRSETETDSPLGSMPLDKATVSRVEDRLIVSPAVKVADHGDLVLSGFAEGEMDKWELAIWRETPKGPAAPSPLTIYCTP